MQIALTLRTTSGKSLGWSEVDGNFTALKQAIESLADSVSSMQFGIEEPLIIATEGQTDFTFSQITYTPGIGSLWCFVNGVRVSKNDVVELSNNSARLPAGLLSAGDEVSWVAGAPVSASVVSDAALVTFSAGGTGAITTNTQRKLREWVTPEDYGAIGDGVANDGMAVQRALNTGKDVRLLPRSTYLINGFALVPTVAGQRIFGGGKLRNTVDSIPAQMIRIDAIDDITIDGIGFDCTGSPTRCYGVTVHGAARTTIRNCRNQASTFAFVWKNSVGTRILDNIIVGGQFGIATGGDATSGTASGVVYDTLIRGNFIAGCTSEAIDVNWDTQRLVIKENLCIGNNTVAREEEIDIGGGVCSDVVISSNIIVSSGASGAARGVTIKLATRGVKVLSNVLIGFDRTVADSAVIRAGNCTDVLIEGNTINGAEYGVVMNSGGGLVKNLRAIRNTIKGFGTAGIDSGSSPTDDIEASGNSIDGGGVGGIGIRYQNCSDFIAFMNRVLGCTGDGIQILATASDGDVTHNRVSGCDDGIVCLASEVNVANNRTWNNQKTGITLTAAKRCGVVNNTIKNNSQGATVYGLQIGAGCNGTTVNANRVYDTQTTKTQRGINFAGASDRVVVTSNYAYDNLSTNLNGIGLLTNSQVADNITA